MEDSRTIRRQLFMRSNIGMTIDRLLAGVIEHSIVTDLEPLQTWVIRIEPRPSPSTRGVVVTVKLPLDDWEEETIRTDDGTLA